MFDKTVMYSSGSIFSYTGTERTSAEENFPHKYMRQIWNKEISTRATGIGMFRGAFENPAFSVMNKNNKILMFLTVLKPFNLPFQKKIKEDVNYFGLRPMSRMMLNVCAADVISAASRFVSYVSSVSIASFSLALSTSRVIQIVIKYI